MRLVSERLAHMTEEACSEIVADVLDAFRAWKESRADPDGTIEVVRYGGLVADPADGFLVRSRKPVDDAEPNECAGPHVTNDIDLAFELLASGDAQLTSAVRRHGLEPVLGTIGIWSWKEAGIGSLAKLNELFTCFVLMDLKTAKSVGKEMFDELKAIDEKKAARIEHMRNVRQKGVQELKLRAAQDHANYKKMAAEYKSAHPRARKQEIVAHIKRCGARQTESTIARLIAGYEQLPDS